MSTIIRLLTILLTVLSLFASCIEVHREPWFATRQPVQVLYEPSPPPQIVQQVPPAAPQPPVAEEVPVQYVDVAKAKARSLAETPAVIAGRVEEVEESLAETPTTAKPGDLVRIKFMTPEGVVVEADRVVAGRWNLIMLDETLGYWVEVPAGVPFSKPVMGDHPRVHSADVVILGPARPEAEEASEEVETAPSEAAPAGETKAETPPAEPEAMGKPAEAKTEEAARPETVPPVEESKAETPPAAKPDSPKKVESRTFWG